MGRSADISPISNRLQATSRLISELRSFGTSIWGAIGSRPWVGLKSSKITETLPEGFLPAAKRHGHAEVQVEKKRSHFCFFGHCNLCFWCFSYFLGFILQFFPLSKKFLKKLKKVKKLIFKNEFPKNCKSSKSCSSLPFGPTPDLSNLLQQSGDCYLEIKLPSRLVVCKTRFYLFQSQDPQCLL